MQKSRLSDYALGIMLYMEEGQQYKIDKISQDLKLNFPTVAKILKILKKSNLVNSHLGRQGGYYLQDKKQNIPLLNIIWAIDGKKNWARCLEGSCILKSTCQWKDSVIDVQNLEEKIFSAITLDDLRNKNDLISVIKSKL